MENTKRIINMNRSAITGRHSPHYVQNADGLFNFIAYNLYKTIKHRVVTHF